MQHARHAEHRRVPNGVKLLALAFVLTGVTAWQGLRQYRSWQSAVQDRLQDADDIERVEGKPEVWASGSSWYPNGTLVSEVRAALLPGEVSQLHALCRRCLWHTLQTCVRAHGISGTTFVATGDIDEMWLRDSAVQVSIYFPRVRQHPSLRVLLEGVIRTQAYYILQDPYANSWLPRWRTSEELDSKQPRGLGRAGFVGTRNYELDSGAYFIGLLWNFAVSPQIRRPGHLLRLPLIHDAVSHQLRTWDIERRHEQRSTYRYAELPRGGMGPPSNYTGMIWSAFRPSDDPNTYGFNVPGNMFAWGALRKARTLNAAFWQDAALEALAEHLMETIREGIEQYGVVATEDGTLVYAYEVDGLGGALSDTDDPNVPSLLAAPLLGYEPLDHEIWRDTAARLQDGAFNPFFYTGANLSGMGSTHTPHQHVWPLAWFVEGLTSGDAGRRAQLLRFALAAQCGSSLQHETIDVTDPSGMRCTRPWFEWANAMLVVFVENALGVDCAATLHAAAGKAAGDAGEAASGSAAGVQLVDEVLPGVKPLAGLATQADAGRVEDFATLEATIRHVWLDKSAGDSWGASFTKPT